jgi:AraC-like DNA-binding protein
VLGTHIRPGRTASTWGASMNTLETSFSAIAIAICLIGVFLVRHLSGRISLFYLVAYLLLEAFGLGAWWLLTNPTSPYKALWLGLLMASSFLMAPALWLLALETSTNRRPLLKTLSVPEWLVIVLGALLTIPLVMTTHGGVLIADPARRDLQTFLINYVHETMLVCIALFLIQVPFYLRKSFTIVQQHIERDFDLFSSIDDMTLNTLRVLIWLMAGNWVLIVARTGRALIMDGPTVLDPLFTCVKAGITLWALAIIIKRAIRLGVTSSIDTNTPENGIADEPDHNRNKYARSALDEITRERIERKLKYAMEEDRVFTRSDLRLRDLCGHLNENTHYVSQIINQSLGTSFYDLVNRYRVEAAKQLLQENPELSVLDIAMEVGFNSKSPFNAAFKKITGMTPKEYRKIRTDSGLFN